MTICLLRKLSNFKLTKTNWAHFCLPTTFEKSLNFVLAKNMNTLSRCFLKRLRLWGVKYRQSIYPCNPYQQHLELLIKHRMVPFTSVTNLFDHRIDARAARKAYQSMLIVFVSLFCLTVIVVCPTPFVREYFVQYFAEQRNSWYFHVSLMGIFGSQWFLCKEHFNISNKSNLIFPKYCF